MCHRGAGVVFACSGLSFRLALQKRKTTHGKAYSEQFCFGQPLSNLASAKLAADTSCATAVLFEGAVLGRA